MLENIHTPIMCLFIYLLGLNIQDICQGRYTQYPLYIEYIKDNLVCIHAIIL